MSQPIWIGQTLGGRYVIEELLGSGGMSSVYKANDPNLRRTVAIKLIHPHLSREPEFVSRFEEEASAVAQLKHPNVIKVFDFNNDGETYFMVMEYIQGETLSDQLMALEAKKQNMASEEALRIATKISAALHYAHQRQMIHRDVKPANIMLDEQGHPILMDFGIAKIIGGKVQTATGAIIGTALYMSPEQIQGKNADARVDIYSLGIVLFEMIAAQTPFGGDSAMTIMMKHVNDPLPNLQVLNPDTSPAVRSVIEKALEKDPQQRFQSAGDMEQALQGVLDSAPAAFNEATVFEQPLPPDGATVLEDGTPAQAARGPALQDLPPVSLPSAAEPRNLSRLISIAGGFVAILLLIVGGGCLSRKWK